MGTLPHKNTLSRLQKVSLSPKFIEAEKVNHNEKTVLSQLKEQEEKSEKLNNETNKLFTR